MLVIYMLISWLIVRTGPQNKVLPYIETFFKISSSVFHKRKSVWNNMRASDDRIVFFYDTGQNFAGQNAK